MRASRFFANPNYADYWSEKIRVKQYEEIYRKEFLQNLQVESKDLVLEVGVGEGRNVLELISKGANYVGIDISGKMLAKTRERIDDQVFDKVDLLVGDALCLPFRQFAFDKVLCFAVVFFLPSQGR